MMDSYKMALRSRRSDVVKGMMKPKDDTASENKKSDLAPSPENKGINSMTDSEGSPGGADRRSFESGHQIGEASQSGDHVEEGERQERRMEKVDKNGNGKPDSEEMDGQMFGSKKPSMDGMRQEAKDLFGDDLDSVSADDDSRPKSLGDRARRMAAARLRK